MPQRKKVKSTPRAGRSRKAAKPSGKPARKRAARSKEIVKPERAAVHFNPINLANPDIEAQSFIVQVNAGRFHGSPRLEWVGPDKFRFVPQRTDPFMFERHTGELIKPGEMITDGGSIPSMFHTIPGFTPWGYGPAYLIHDWEFEAQRRGMGKKSFEDVNLTLAEGIKTLMEAGKVPRNIPALYAIWTAVSSMVGRAIWDRRE